MTDDRVVGGEVDGDAGQLRDVDRLVADPLEVQVHVQDRRDQAEIRRDRGLCGEQRQDPLLDVDIGGVDRVIVLNDLLRQRFVLVRQGLDGVRHRHGGPVSHAQDLALQRRELVMESVTGLVHHQPNRPVT